MLCKSSAQNGPTALVEITTVIKDIVQVKPNGDILTFEKKTESRYKEALYDRIDMLDFNAGTLNYKLLITSKTLVYL